MENSIKTQDQIKWCTTKGFINANYKNSETRRYTTFLPLKKGLQPSLRFTIHCNYPGLGEKEFCYEVSEDLLRASSVYPQGWPAQLFYFAKIASFFGWPHAKHITWPQEHKKKTLELFCMHRLIDLLGILSLMHPNRLPAGYVFSYCSGHWADSELVKIAQGHIRLLD